MNPTRYLPTRGVPGRIRGRLPRGVRLTINDPLAEAPEGAGNIRRPDLNAPR